VFRNTPTRDKPQRTPFVGVLIARTDNSTQSGAITGPPRDPQTEFEPGKSAAREFRQQKPAGIVKHLECPRGDLNPHVPKDTGT